MAKLIDIIKKIFPNGTSPLLPRSWENPPIWPPDAFAISATLINHSGCYADQRYSTTGTPNYFFTETISRELQADGNKWAKRPFPNDTVQNRVASNWQIILQYGGKDLSDIKLPEDYPLCDALITLMLLADEASAGIGFYDPDAPQPMNFFIYKEHSEALRNPPEGNPPTIRRFNNTAPLASSLTWMVDLTLP